MITDESPVLTVSQAAQLAGMHPQTLRQYDRLGLVTPRRTLGRGRRYSRRDVARLLQVQQLAQGEGINLAGIKRILDLQEHVTVLEQPCAARGPAGGRGPRRPGGGRCDGALAPGPAPRPMNSVTQFFRNSPGLFLELR